MDAGQTLVSGIHGSWGIYHVNDDVGNLAPEQVGRDPGWVGTTWVLVAVNDPATSEVAAGLDHGTASCVADDVGIVEVDDGARYAIGARREVDGSRSRGGTITSRAASVGVADGQVDGGRVIIDAITSSTIVLDVAEDWVVLNNGIGSKTLVGNVLEPVVTASSRAGRGRGRGGGGGGSGSGTSGSSGACGGSGVGS